MVCVVCGKPSRAIELDHGNNPFYVGNYFSPPKVNLCGCQDDTIDVAVDKPTSTRLAFQATKIEKEPGAHRVSQADQLVSKEVTVKTTSGEYTLKTARFVNSFKSSPNNPFDVTSTAALPNVKKVVTQEKKFDLSSEKPSRSIWDIIKDADLSCQPRYLWDSEVMFKKATVIDDQLETKTEIVVTAPSESTWVSSDKSSRASYAPAISEPQATAPIRKHASQQPKVEVVTTKIRTTSFVGPQMSPNNPFEISDKPLRKVNLAAIKFGMCIRGRKYPARMENLIDGSPLKPRLLSFQ
ncbi:hypothetical protein K7432_002932 [Basidiobolus ranarum]|uniref:Uncharacterized protein n=1 Tax=Basidiobolus ranarum TaxID=34480 RepID=A0ABR2X0Q0_9FUNG